MSKTTTRTKNNIIDAFLKILQTESINNISIQDIVNASGVNRSTFYRYFNSISDLQVASLRKIAKSNLKPNAKFPEIIRQMTDLIFDYKKLLRNLFPSTDRFYAEGFELVQKFLNNVLIFPIEKKDLVLQLITSSSSKELMIKYISGAIVGVVSEVLIDDSLTRTEVANFLLERLQNKKEKLS